MSTAKALTNRSASFPQPQVWHQTYHLATYQMFSFCPGNFSFSFNDPNHLMTSFPVIKEVIFLGLQTWYASLIQASLYTLKSFQCNSTAIVSVKQISKMIYHGENGKASERITKNSECLQVIRTSLQETRSVSISSSHPDVLVNILIRVHDKIRIWLLYL